MRSPRWYFANTHQQHVQAQVSLCCIIPFLLGLWALVLLLLLLLNSLEVFFLLLINSHVKLRRWLDAALTVVTCGRSMSSFLFFLKAGGASPVFGFWFWGKSLGMKRRNVLALWVPSAPGCPFLSVPFVFSQGEDAVPPCDGRPPLQGELPEPLAVRQRQRRHGQHLRGGARRSVQLLSYILALSIISAFYDYDYDQIINTSLLISLLWSVLEILEVCWVEL